MTGPSDRRQFPFRFAGFYRGPALVFGVTPASAKVVLDEDRLRVRFGPWRVETDLANVAAAHRTGPYSRVKTVGPAHLSLSDQGLTFATNAEAGVCIEFLEPVRGIEPLGLIRHPGLTVTVADCSGLIAALPWGDSDPGSRHP